LNIRLLNLKSYLVQTNQMNPNEIAIDLKMKNVASASQSNIKANSQIYSIEFNMIDTAALKLIREQVNDII
jgi:hypothetical protein